MLVTCLIMITWGSGTKIQIFDIWSENGNKFCWWYFEASCWSRQARTATKMHNLLAKTKILFLLMSMLKWDWNPHYSVFCRMCVTNLISSHVSKKLQSTNRFWHRHKDHKYVIKKLELHFWLLWSMKPLILIITSNGWSFGFLSKTQPYHHQNFLHGKKLYRIFQEK